MLKNERYAQIVVANIRNEDLLLAKLAIMLLKLLTFCIVIHGFNNDAIDASSFEENQHRRAAPAKCNNNDISLWISRGGFDNIGDDVDFCANDFPGGKCLSGILFPELDEECTQDCSESLGYSPQCSTCFVNAGVCIFDSNCVFPCGLNGPESDVCQNCLLNTQCDENFFECSGLPEDISPTPPPTPPPPPTPRPTLRPTNRPTPVPTPRPTTPSPIPSPTGGPTGGPTTGPTPRPIPGPTSSSDLDTIPPAECRYRLKAADTPYVQDGLKVTFNYLVCDHPLIIDLDNLQVTLFKMPKDSPVCSESPTNNVPPVIIAPANPTLTEVCYDGDTEVDCDLSGTLDRLVTVAIEIDPAVQDNSDDFYSVDDISGYGVASFCIRLTVEDYVWEDSRLIFNADIEDGAFTVQDPILIIPSGGSIHEIVEEFSIGAEIKATGPFGRRDVIPVGLAVIASRSRVARFETLDSMVFQAFGSSGPIIGLIQSMDRVDLSVCDGEVSCQVDFRLPSNFSENFDVEYVQVTGDATLELCSTCSNGGRRMQEQQQPVMTFKKGFGLEFEILPNDDVDDVPKNGDGDDEEEALIESIKKVENEELSLLVIFIIVVVAVLVVLLLLLKQGLRLRNGKNSSLQ